MPNPAEIAELMVNGSIYRDWETVTVQRGFQQTASIMTFAAASPIESGTWAGQKLKIGDRCTCRLAGVEVANGLLATRQVVYDARSHALQVQASSKTADLAYASVAQSGGFKNNTLSGISNNLLKPHGIKFRIDGSPAGAEKPFARFHVQPGETVVSAIARLCQMRNIWLTDDEKGNLVGKRLDRSEGPMAHLEEGRNIKSAMSIMSAENIHDRISVLGSQPGNDQRWGDQARDSSASVSNPEALKNRALIVRSPEPGDADDMKMHAEYLAAENIATMIQAEITVQGWHDPEGALWIKSVGKNVTVKSPMLFPSGSKVLAIQGITHRQTSQAGTETVLSLILPALLKGADRIDASGNAEGGAPPVSMTKPAQPEPSDVVSL
ncbi:phage baseplate assembly protein [Bosea sp. BK604]|uniref:phage baseplate assembly protein n=1 Tax=Bosea sp. BK604 TaxID=2512180 RepID=UPI00105246A0|nr:hypothetical protein [Bosea sp. BK604]TCR60940.1 prophage tail gpP-like protein [Bosea sp. BK604]